MSALIVRLKHHGVSDKVIQEALGDVIQRQPNFSVAAFLQRLKASLPS